MAENHSSRLNRRSLVAGAGVVALGVVAVSGCGGADQATGPSSSGPSRSGAAGTALGAVSDVPVGGGKVFELLEVVVTQPTAGDFRGFSASCTHTGCVVAEVVGGTINCPCHGSRFNLDGTVANGPAPRALPSRPVTIDDGKIVLT